MKKFSMTATDDLHYPEYKRLNWVSGVTYKAEEIGGGVLKVHSETGPFFFSGDARENLWRVFEIQEEMKP